MRSNVTFSSQCVFNVSLFPHLLCVRVCAGIAGVDVGACVYVLCVWMGAFYMIEHKPDVSRPL